MTCTGFVGIRRQLLFIGDILTKHPSFEVIEIARNSLHSRGLSGSGANLIARMILPTKKWVLSFPFACLIQMLQIPSLLRLNHHSDGIAFLTSELPWAGVLGSRKPTDIRVFEAPERMAKPGSAFRVYGHRRYTTAVAMYWARASFEHRYKFEHQSCNF